MKLRELFDKLTPGMLDEPVRVQLVKRNEIRGRLPNITVRIRELKSVEITDSGAVTLIVDE